MKPLTVSRVTRLEVLAALYALCFLAALGLALRQYYQSKQAPASLPVLRPAFTVATLPHGLSPGTSAWCSDCIQSRGVGGIVTWNGTNWITTDNIKATANVEEYMIGRATK